MRNTKDICPRTVSFSMNTIWKSVSMKPQIHNVGHVL